MSQESKREENISQSQRFADAARELGADVDEETLRRTVSKIARPRPVDKEADSKDKEGKGR